MNTKVLMFLSVLLFAGCISETLDPCPVGDVKINIYVEKFQAVTHDFRTDMEVSFNTRIKDIHYFLFKDNALLDEGRISDCTPYVTSPYTFERRGLEFGDYCLAMVSNCSAYVGGQAPADLYFTYAGVDNKEDYFAVCFPFRVDCDCQSEYNAYMERVHGVIRYTFSDVPDDISGMDVTMTNLGNKKLIDGDYSGQMEVTKRIPVGQLPRADKTDDDITVVLGTFPTTTGMRSAYRLQLYRNGENEPWYDETVTDTLTVRRNQFLDIATRFTGDIPSFEVKINTAWDGSNSGGDTDIH